MISKRSGAEKQPKHFSLGGISRPGGHEGGRPGPKTFTPSLEGQENKGFCADVLDPNARTSMTQGGSQKNSIQKNSRRLWRSQRRKSSSVPAGAANFPAAVFLAGKCPNLGRDSISRCRKIGESSSSSVEICRKTFPAENFGQPQPSRVF